MICRSDISQSFDNYKTLQAHRDVKSGQANWLRVQERSCLKHPWWLLVARHSCQVWDSDIIWCRERDFFIIFFWSNDIHDRRRSLYPFIPITIIMDQLPEKIGDQDDDKERAFSQFTVDCTRSHSDAMPWAFYVDKFASNQLDDTLASRHVWGRKLAHRLWFATVGFLFAQGITSVWPSELRVDFGVGGYDQVS